MEREIASILLKTKAVTLSPGKPFIWASGIKSPIYTDNRIVLSYTEERKMVVRAFVDIIEKKCPDFDVIAGVATSGIPWAAWVADALGKPLVYARAKKKEYGKGNMIEGRLDKGKRAVVIEDLVSTGGSSIAAVQAVRDAGAKVTHCFAIFAYGLPEANKNFQDADCKLVTLTDFNALVGLASETGYITPDEKDRVLKFSEDPSSWKW